MKKILFALFIGFLTSLPNLTLAASTWPGSDTGTNLSAGITAYYNVGGENNNEPSGLVWNTRLNHLFIVMDNGYLGELDASGNVLRNWHYSGGLDIEGITQTTPDSDKLYLAEENPEQKIYEFSITNWALTGKTWTLNGMAVDATNGMEALTYAQGNFYAGSQLNGIIYVYPVDLNTSGALTYSRTIATGTGDLADLNYQPEQNILYALFDSTNRLREYTLEGTQLNSFTLPSDSDNREGLAFIPNYPQSTTQVYIGEDDGHLRLYTSFPINTSRYDHDTDGVNYTLDCNDNDGTVSTSQNYYADIDTDGYGSTSATAICASTPPSGYALNNTDCNDYDGGIHAVQTFYLDIDHDGYGSTSTGNNCSLTPTLGYANNNTDCSDSDASIHTNQTYYRDADNDGLGDPNNYTQICSLTIPAGYVTNNSDANDTPITYTLNVTQQSKLIIFTINGTEVYKLRIWKNRQNNIILKPTLNYLSGPSDSRLTVTVNNNQFTTVFNGETRIWTVNNDTSLAYRGQLKTASNPFFLQSLRK